MKREHLFQCVIYVFLCITANTYCAIGTDGSTSNKGTGILNTALSDLMEHTAICCKITNMKRHVDCSNLKLKKIPECYQLKLGNCSSITDLKLASNRISVIQNKSFVSYPNLRSLDLSYNPLRYIDELAFDSLTVLETLTIIDTNSEAGKFLTVIRDRAFAPLKKIRSLTLSETSLDPRHFLQNVMCHVPSNLENLFIQTMVAYTEELSTVQLKAKAAKCFKHLKRLKNLSFDHNLLGEISASFLMSVRHLEHVSLRRNHVYGNRAALRLFYFLTNITFFDIGCQFIKACGAEYVYPENIPKWKDTKDLIEPLIENLVKEKEKTQIMVYFLKNASVLHLDHLPTSDAEQTIPDVCWANNKMVEIDISFTPIETINGKIQCFWYLKFLNIRGIKAMHIDYFIFEDLISLEILLLADAIPGLNLGAQSAAKLFENTKMITYLELSENRIISLHSDLFTQLYDLRFLNLSHNQIQSWNGNLENLTNLEYIVLSHNSFNQIPMELFAVLERNMKLLNRTTTLDISKNPFRCTCTAIFSIMQMQMSKVDVINLNSNDNPLHCSLENGTFISFAEVVKMRNYLCKHSQNVLFAFVLYVTAVITTITSALGYRYRWKVKYAWYTAMQLFLEKEHERRDYRFDVFVSYCSDDEAWIMKNLIPKLEQDLGYNLCLHYRHFIAGRNITDNIVGAVKASRKTLLVITKNFMRSGWCEFETQFAHTHHLQRHTAGVVAVIHPQVFDMRGPSYDSLDQLLNYVTYLEWPVDVEQKSVFWINLRRALGPPMLRIQELEDGDNEFGNILQL